MDEKRLALTGSAKQEGFSLVELMVALLIGLVIILGAGQLFLTGFQNFRKVEELGDKQAALTFAADVLVREIRRSEKPVEADDDELIVYIDGESRRYFLSESSGEWSLYVQVDSDSSQPVVDGFQGSDAFSVEEPSSGHLRVTFDLVGEKESIIFHAMNRTEAVAD
ncbi:PilW family protein [Halomonas faecis]|uniref:PilW family protein n=1 Tax=Halomonas faecis TaxID=1562110 RepID=UPI0013D7FA6D|nr:prepilin-type N-terminal cleavage/methylation domain-containing protein [Halomonas faecis]